MSRKYTAYSKDPAVIERVLDKMEGLLLTLRNARLGEDGRDHRPQAMPPRHIASQLGCSIGTVQRWLKYHSGRRDEYEISDRYCELYQLIANELSEVVGSAQFAIACNPNNPQAARVQLALLPKMDPWTYGDASHDDRESTTTADIPSPVFDELSDTEREVLAQIAARRDEDDAAVDKIIADAAARVAENEDRDDDQ